MNNLHIQEIGTEAEFLAIKDEWQALESLVQDMTVFQTWVFQYHCWKIFVDTVTPTIVLFRDKNGALLGVAPLGCRIEKIGPLSCSVLGFTCLKYCDFQNILVHADHVGSVMRAFASWLEENLARWDHIELRLIREDFSAWQSREILQDAFGNRISFQDEGTAPYIAIDPNWNDFQNALSGKRAKSIRYEIRNLFRNFEGEFKKHHEGADLEAALQVFMDLHQKRIRQKYQLGAFATLEIRKGFTELVRALEEYGYVNIHSIASSEKTIAAIGTFLYKGVVSYFQGGFDTEYQRVSPGKVVLALRITSAIQEKYKEFDFLFGEENYKFAWSTGQRTVHQMTIKTGSFKQAIFIWYTKFKSKLQASDRFRALYFKLLAK